MTEAVKIDAMPAARLTVCEVLEELLASRLPLTDELKDLLSPKVTTATGAGARFDRIRVIAHELASLSATFESIAGIVLYPES